MHSEFWFLSWSRTKPPLQHLWNFWVPPAKVQIWVSFEFGPDSLRTCEGTMVHLIWDCLSTSWSPCECFRWPCDMDVHCDTSCWISVVSWNWSDILTRIDLASQWKRVDVVGEILAFLLTVSLAKNKQSIPYYILSLIVPFHLGSLMILLELPQAKSAKKPMPPCGLTLPAFRSAIRNCLRFPKSASIIQLHGVSLESLINVRWFPRLESGSYRKMSNTHSLGMPRIKRYWMLLGDLREQVAGEASHWYASEESRIRCGTCGSLSSRSSISIKWKSHTSSKYPGYTSYLSLGHTLLQNMHIVMRIIWYCLLWPFNICTWQQTCIGFLDGINSIKFSYEGMRKEQVYIPTHLIHFTDLDHLFCRLWLSWLDSHRFRFHVSGLLIFWVLGRALGLTLFHE